MFFRVSCGILGLICLRRLKRIIFIIWFDKVVFVYDIFIMIVIIFSFWFGVGVKFKFYLVFSIIR